MEKKNECEIVQDLLLGYVDEILNKETPVDSIEIKKDDKLSISN